MSSLLYSEGRWRGPQIRIAGGRGGAVRSRRPCVRGTADGALERTCDTARAHFAATLDIELVSPVAQTIATSVAAAATSVEASSGEGTSTAVTSAATAAAFAARVHP
jgi:hypothetical protein